MGSSPFLCRRRHAPLLVLCLALGACGDGLSPKDLTVDFGEFFLPGAYPDRAPLTNTSPSKQVIESVALPGFSGFSVLTDFPAEVDGGTPFPIDFQFSPEPEEFGLYEQTATASVTRSGGADYELLIHLRALYTEGDVDRDGVVGLAFGGLDCDDNDPSVYPGAPELCDGKDNDCSGAPGAAEVDEDLDGWFGCDDDCDDGDVQVHPEAPEGCDGVDTDCDGSPGADELDGDGDGSSACEGDCEPENATVHPGAVEICDGVDNDCSDGGGVDPSEVDDDGDGSSECEGDCDDGNALAHPGASEDCDGFDTDCDGVLSGDEYDLDGDAMWECEGDCDDTDLLVFLGALEICDGKDSDCDGVIPPEEEDDDADGDLNCADCDDTDDTINSAAIEICDGVDNNCDTLIDEGFDADGDGISDCAGDCDDGDPAVFPGALEICNGVDDDCDSVLLLGEDSDGDTDGDLDCADGDCPLYVDSAWTGLEAGTLAAPFGSLAGAMVTAPSLGCISLYLQPGSYATPIDFGTLPWRLSGPGGAASTFLEGAGSGPVVTIAGGQSAAAGLVGLTVRGGVSAGNGGGVYLSGADVVLRGCVLSGNSADGSGGGLYSEIGTPLLEFNRFENNSATFDGGGAMITNASEEVLARRNVFANNSAGDDGGGIYAGSTALIFEQNLVLSNVAIDEGGGLKLANSNGAGFYNNLFDGNVAQDAGAVFLLGSGPFFENNVLVDNHSTDPMGLGGIRILDGLFRNNIIAYGTGYGVEVVNTPLTGDFHYNDVYGWSAGNFFGPDRTGTDGNISEQPLFSSLSQDGEGGNDDLHLLPGSPAIDAGHPASVFRDPDGSRADMGLYGGAGGNW